MPKRRTSKTGRPRPKVLQLQVNSPRIVYFRVFGAIKHALKLLLIPAAAIGMVWAAGYGLQHAFLRNDEFRLGLIDLNPNPALDEQRIVELGEIDVNGSLFEIDIDRLRQTLAGLPELCEAGVERELPDTLRVRVVARIPVAWLEMPGRAIPGRDVERGLLVDERGIPFPCVPGLVGRAAGLPVIVVQSPDTPAPVPGVRFRPGELTRGLEMIKLCRSVPGIDEFPIERIEQEDEWSILMHTRDGVVARFGLVDRERQLADFVAACRHARNKDYELATIDLIPERNIPVTFAKEPPPPTPPPRAIPVVEPARTEPPPDEPRARPLPALLDRS